MDETSGMTYQLGAENMTDPLGDDALVSLSELRDAQFFNANTFACGYDFVIGMSQNTKNNKAKAETGSPFKQMMLSPKHLGPSPKPSPSPSPYKRNLTSRHSSYKDSPSQLTQEKQVMPIK